MNKNVKIPNIDRFGNITVDPKELLQSPNVRETINDLKDTKMNNEAELLKDQQRLEAMLVNEWRVRGCLDMWFCEDPWNNDYWVDDYLACGTTAREAIDNAMEKINWKKK